MRATHAAEPPRAVELPPAVEVARAAPVARREPEALDVAVPATTRVPTPPPPPPEPVHEPAPAIATRAPAPVPAEPPPPADVEELDMADAEIVELGGEASPGAVADADFEAELREVPEEPVPESAPRPAAQALAEVDLEPPVKTPPPESGRQVVAAPHPEPKEAELPGTAGSDLLEADLSGGPISKAPPGMPTVSQLGETVELEGADGSSAELELAPPAGEAEEAAEPDALELTLPKKEFAGAYDAALAPPSHAQEDLERHRRAEHERAGVASLVSPSSIDVSAATVPAVRPVVVERPATDVVHAAEMVVSRPPKLPETFVELLDASLSL